MKEFRPEDCLECPFVRVKDKRGGGTCWLYKKPLVAKAEQRPPDFCRLITIIVNEKAEEPEEKKK